MLRLMILLLGSTSILLGKSVIFGNYSSMIGKFHEFNYVVDKYDNSSAVVGGNSGTGGGNSGEGTTTEIS